MTTNFYGDTSTLDIGLHYRPDEAERLAKVFQGKSVALVANGPSAGIRQSGVDVDKHDLVVRMNRFNIFWRHYVGQRMDVHAFSGFAANHCSPWGGLGLYYCSDGFIEKKNIQRWHNGDNLLFWARHKGPWEDFLGEAWPTTGLRVLLDVLNSGAKSVTLLGYDVSKDSHFFNKHNPAAEREYIEHLTNTDPRVTWITP